MANDDDLTRSVNDELFWDSKLDNHAIAASACGGEVTLRGTVGSLREKHEATKAAQRVFGVVSVDNQLQVRPLDDDARVDADIRGDVLQALMLDSTVPRTVDAKAHDGVVTLTGTAAWQFQREEAETVASSVTGVVEVIDEIELEHPEPQGGEVKTAIENAFRRNATIDADDLSVTTSNGTVTISGVVSSSSEHTDAITAAWSVPGVTSVNDQIKVEY
jgi:osmotically-inducible protein OsmY